MDCEIVRLSRAFARAGFECVDTGGGCRAYRRERDDGKIEVVTVWDDAALPDRFDDRVLWGLYLPGEHGELWGDDLDFQDFESARAFLARRL